MSNARINIRWQHRTICLLVTAMLLSCAVQAQLSLKRQKYDSIAAKYSNEHAIYTDVNHHLVIREEGGALVATSTEIREKLFISERSLNHFNRDAAHDASFSYFNSFGATLYIPEKNDYRVVNNVDRDGDVSFDYSGIRKNSITRTSYSATHEELRLLPRFFFSNNIPTLSAVLEVTAPKFVKMGFLVKSPDSTLIKRTTTEKDGNIIYRFTAINVPANKNNEFVPSGKYYMPHVIPYVISFRTTGAKRDSVLSGVDAHRNFQYRYVHGLNLKTDSFLNKKTAELIKHAYSEREKVTRIYDWVQQNFHYLALFTDEMQGFVPNPADTVCKRMYGDCKDMSSILMAMCQKAGISAYFTAIGSDDQPYTHDEIQSEYLYDHMICAVKLDGEWVFLDGTTHIQPLGVDRRDLQGKEAFIMLDNDHHKVVKIPEAPASQNVLIDNTTMNLEYNDVTGTTYQRYSGYGAWDIAENLAYLNRKEDRDEYIKDLTSRGNSKYLVTRYDANASKSGNRDVTINANYKLGGYAQQVKREYFVNMNVKTTFSSLRMNEEDRNIAMFLPYKKTIKETVTLNIPKGYRLKSLPKNAKGGKEGLWSYSITYKSDAKNGTVTLSKEYVLHTMHIAPSQFEANNALVDELKKQYKETVVLTAK
jgi:hypothetical protein